MVSARHSKNRRISIHRPPTVPSHRRIEQLANEIRKNWSPQTRANRAAIAAHRMEAMLACFRELGGQYLVK
jgi:hypothetical protein